jgi:hypothetical protein
MKDQIRIELAQLEKLLASGLFTEDPLNQSTDNTDKQS